ncbi:MAG: sugar phosphate isomerase/epimerase family protein [Eubacteriales bacterium]
MGFKYASADFTYPLLPHDKVISLIALLGFDGVDIGLFENRSHLQPSAVLHEPKKNGKILGRKTADAGLCVADVFLQCDVDFWPKAINHADKKVRDETRDYFSKMIDYALAAGARHITCLPGVHYTEEGYDASYGRALDELQWRIETAKNANLIFGIEPHLGGIVDSPEKALKLIGDLPGITITLDYTHFTKIGIPDEAVAPLIPYATHFHARGAKEGALQTVLPDNTIDYPAIVQGLQKAGYSGFIGIEYIWMDWEGCNRTDNVSESIRLRELMKKAENGGI